MIYLLLLSGGIILFGVVVGLLNLFCIRKINIFKKNKIEVFPLISVLIPARNEEMNIETCVRSVFSQSYSNLQIIVLDDMSTDKTLTILKKLQIEFPSLQIVYGKERPNDWIGKPWACHNLSLHANGEYLIFLDADTQLQPNCIQTIISEMVTKKIDMGTFIPKHITRTFSERIFVPILSMYGIISYFPLFYYFINKRSSTVIAWGYLMIFSKTAYKTMGGHESVKHTIMDDAGMARVAASFKQNIGFYDGSNIFSCRMYRNFDDVYSGFFRASVPFISKSPFTYILFSLLGILSYSFIPVWFVISLILGTSLPNLFFSLGLFISLAPIIIRLCFSLKFNLDLTSVPFLFVCGTIIPVFLIYVSWRILMKQPFTWKERVYNT